MIEIKICTKCNKKLPATTEYFYKHKDGKYGLEGYCRECRKKQMKQRKKKILKWYINYKKQLSCEKCGEKRWYCLIFHHINPLIKIMDVGHMVGDRYSKKKIIEEINKCIVLCCNCHAELHYLEEK